MDLIREWFLVIGAGLAIILTIMKLFPRMPHFLKRGYLRIKRGVSIFREWRWWKQYCPTCKIVSVGKVKIIRVDEQFHIELPIEVEYISRDSRYATRMDCTSILLDMYNRGKGRDKEPYRLNSRIKLLCWDLLPMANERKQYNFIRDEEGTPLLTNSTSCKIIEIGKAHVHGISGSRSLNPITIKKVDICWETDK